MAQKRWGSTDQWSFNFLDFGFVFSTLWPVGREWRQEKFGVCITEIISGVCKCVYDSLPTRVCMPNVTCVGSPAAMHLIFGWLLFSAALELLLL